MNFLWFADCILVPMGIGATAGSLAREGQYGYAATVGLMAVCWLLRVLIAKEARR